MTSYGVIVQPRAERDIEQAHRYLVAHAPSTADRWLNGILEAILSLEEMPSRCPVAPESAHVSPVVRHLVHNDYRIIFLVPERHVRVLTVRHSARKPLRRLRRI